MTCQEQDQDFSRSEYAKLAKKLDALKGRARGKAYATTVQARRHLADLQIARKRLQETLSHPERAVSYKHYRSWRKRRGRATKNLP